MFLHNFKQNLADVRDQSNCVIIETIFRVTLFWQWNEYWAFPILWPSVDFPIFFWHWSLMIVGGAGLSKSTTTVSTAEILMFSSCFIVDMISYSMMASSISTSLSLSIWYWASFLPVYNSSVYSYHLFLMPYWSDSSFPCLFLMIPLWAIKVAQIFFICI